MKTLALLVIHVLTTLAQRAGPGGAKTIIAESVLLKHQQLIVRRSAGKTPKLTTSDRFLCGFLTLFMRPGRIRKAAVILKPATLTKFRRALVSRNYRLLFSSHKKRKPGPKGPSDALVLVIHHDYRSNYSAIHLEAKHGALNNAYPLFLIPSSLDEKRSARISMATAISHAESQNFVRKRYCPEELRTLIAA